MGLLRRRSSSSQRRKITCLPIAIGTRNDNFTFTAMTQKKLLQSGAVSVNSIL